jgi:hypothetical protein
LDDSLFEYPICICQRITYFSSKIAQHSNVASEK